MPCRCGVPNSMEHIISCVTCLLLYLLCISMLCIDNIRQHRLCGRMQKKVALHGIQVSDGYSLPKKPWSSAACWIKFANGNQYLPSGSDQHSHGKSSFLIGKPSINWPCSMAMLNNQRVCFFESWFTVLGKLLMFLKFLGPWIV